MWVSLMEGESFFLMISERDMLSSRDDEEISSRRSEESDWDVRVD